MNFVLRNRGFGWPALINEPLNTLVHMRVDVHEIDRQIEIQADLPGVKEQDISITLKNDILTVSAIKNTESVKVGKDNIVWRERSSGSFTRSFNVISGTTRKDISAEFTDGVLTLSVTRSKGEKATRGSHQIPIR